MEAAGQTPEVTKLRTIDVASFWPDLLKEAQKQALVSGDLQILARCGKVFRVHSLVLSKACPWLGVNIVDVEDTVIAIDDVLPETIDAFVALLYQGHATVWSDQVASEIQGLFRLSVDVEGDSTEEDNVSLSFQLEDNLGCLRDSGPKQKPRGKTKRVFTANLSPDDLTCKICRRTFTALYKLRIHTLVHSATPPFVCSYCGRGFNNKYKMRGHEKKHCSGSRVSAPKEAWPDSESLDKRINCEKCGAVFDTKKARGEHIMAAHPLYHASNHTCPLCGKVFKGLKGLNNHINNASCQKPRRDQSQQHPRDPPLMFKCDNNLCRTVCSSRKSLLIHGRTAHLEDGEEALPFRCLTCGKAFLKQSYLEEHHNRFHNAIKPFACMFCPKRCATKQDLDRHLMSHRGEAVFQCSFCPRSFVHRASLKKHQRRHLGERPYQCHPCRKSYGLLSVLKKHQKAHERKGDLTRLFTASKGQRGTLTYVDYAEESQGTLQKITDLSQMQVVEASSLTAVTRSRQSSGERLCPEPELLLGTTMYNESQPPAEEHFPYMVAANHQEPLVESSTTEHRFCDLTETESIAMDILGLLSDQHGPQQTAVDKL